MATHTAFLRKKGIDDDTIVFNNKGQIGVAPGAFNPNAGFGKVYWVDKSTGTAGGNGLTPDAAMLTIAQAITASNLTVGSYNMNTIYVNANTYTEDLTTVATNCNVIGIGSKVRIQGNLTIDSSQINSRWWNMQFRENDALPIISIGAACHGFELHNCRLEDQGSCTMAIDIAGSSQDVVIEGCKIGMGSPPPIGIQVAGAACKGLDIKNNMIFAVTTGISVAAAVASTYQATIRGNIIEKGDPTGFSDQLDFGIKFLKSDGAQGITCVDNRISADDAIFFEYTGSNHYQWYCLANRTGQGGTAAWEDA